LLKKLNEIFIKKRRIVFPILISSFLFFPIFLFLIKGYSKSSEGKCMLKLVLDKDIQSLDVGLAFNGNSSTIATMLFEGLTRIGKNYKPHLALAESVDISRDHMKYVFHLKESKWSDGTPLTAHDFVFAWKRALDPSTKAVTRMPLYFYPIKNAKQCLDGEISTDEVPIHALDDQTLSVELEYPTPYFLDMLTFPVLFPLPKHIVENVPDWERSKNFVFNGPFKLEKWKRDIQMVFVKNPYYWDEENVHLDGVDITVVPDTNTSLLLYEKGEVDWVGDPFFRVSYDISYKILDKERDGVQVYWIFMNLDKFPLHNKKFRQALSYSLDREEILYNIFGGAGESIRTVLPPFLKVQLRDSFNDDPFLAKNLLNEALEELNMKLEELPALEFRCVGPVEFHGRIAQAIQDQWRKNLGIKISITKTDWPTHFDAISNGNYELGLMGWFTTIPDPVSILENFKNKKDANNKCNWEHPDFKDCIDQTHLAVGQIERMRHIQKAEEILMEEMPVIPLLSTKQRYAHNPKLKDVIFTPFRYIDFKYAYFED